MKRLHRGARPAALIGLALLAASMASAQVNSINSAKLSPREFNDDPLSDLTVSSNYPDSISFSDQSVDTGNFANRHVWRFSNDLGATAFQFSNDDFFHVSMNVTLTGDPISPRKEAGFLFDTLGGQGQFIVNTDGHEVVAFGGPLPFYAFPATFDSGETIELDMTYFLDSDGKRKIIYSANGVNSPAQEFTNLEQGIINGSTLGGYLQVAIDPGNQDNGGTAVFTDISIAAVPEPSAFVTLGMSLASLGQFLRRRKR